ncbi:PHB depolymerase family esterase [soil metagenome]
MSPPALRARSFALLLPLLVACTRHAAEGREPESREARAEVAFQDLPLEVGGRTRTYALHVPASRQGPLPLVISLHGAGGHGRGVEQQSGWGALAEREGFVVAYPDGIGKTWNDGRADTPSRSVKENVDDVAFLAALIEDVAARGPIDRRRVFLNGLSNGAFMTSRFACERAGMVAAIGLVAGTIGPDVLAACRPARPLSVISFSGTADPLVPFTGGFVRLGIVVRGKAASYEDATRLWVDRFACATPAERSMLPDRDPDDGSTARLDAYGCPDGGAVHAYTLLGGGHTWPGGRQYLPRLIVGPVNRDVDATQAMWAFFAAHPAP